MNGCVCGHSLTQHSQFGAHVCLECTCLVYTGPDGPDRTPDPTHSSELPPLDDPPRVAREKRIRDRILRDTRETLNDMLEGFDDAPTRTLMLIGNYVQAQRDAISLLGVPDENPASFLEATGQGTIMREFMALLKDMIKNPPQGFPLMAPRPAITLPPESEPPTEV